MNEGKEERRADWLEGWNESIVTPAYVFDLDELKDRLQMIRRCLGNRIRLCYAMKANPFLVEPLQNFVDKYEVCSPGEFRICERHQIPMEQIVLSGVYKEEREICHAVKTYGGKGTFTIESKQQLEILENCAADAGKNIQALLRVSSGNQFGMDEEAIAKVLEDRWKYPHVNISGFQYYSGTQKKKLKKMEQELEYLDQMMKEMETRYGYRAEELEYGPGFYVPYFQSDDEVDDEALLDAFSRMLNRLHFQGIVTLEAGRYLAAYCGYYLTRIVDQKINRGQRYGIVDGGIHHLSYFGQMMAMKIPHFLHLSQKEEEEKELWNICGSLCTVNDVLVKNLPLSNAAIGDLLVFERVGAYSVTEGIYLFLSRDLPRIFSYSRECGMQLMREGKRTDEWNQEEQLWNNY